MAVLPLLLVLVRFGCKGVAVIEWTVAGRILVPARQSQKSKSNEINMLQVEGGNEHCWKGTAPMEAVPGRPPVVCNVFENQYMHITHVGSCEPLLKLLIVQLIKADPD